MTGSPRRIEWPLPQASQPKERARQGAAAPLARRFPPSPGYGGPDYLLHTCESENLPDRSDYYEGDGEDARSAAALDRSIAARLARKEQNLAAVAGVETVGGPMDKWSAPEDHRPWRPGWRPALS